MQVLFTQPAVRCRQENGSARLVYQQNLAELIWEVYVSECSTLFTLGLIAVIFREMTNQVSPVTFPHSGFVTSQIVGRKKV